MKPIGAWLTIRWFDDSSEGFKYASFGTYDESEDADSFGVLDETIFYYFEGVEDFLIQIEKGFREFEVLSYELEGGQ